MEHALHGRWNEVAADAAHAMARAALCAGIYETRRAWAGGAPVVVVCVGNHLWGVWLEAAGAHEEVLAGWVAARLHLDCGTGDIGEVTGSRVWLGSWGEAPERVLAGLTVAARLPTSVDAEARSAGIAVPAA